MLVSSLSEVFHYPVANFPTTVAHENLRSITRHHISTALIEHEMLGFKHAEVCCGNRVKEFGAYVLDLVQTTDWGLASSSSLDELFNINNEFECGITENYRCFDICCRTGSNSRTNFDLILKVIIAEIKESVRGLCLECFKKGKHQGLDHSCEGAQKH